MSSSGSFSPIDKGRAGGGESAPALEKRVRYLEERIDYLEEISRFTLDALEMAASLGDFQTSFSRLHDTSVILAESRQRILKLIHFDAVAFFLIDQDDNYFSLAYCEPASKRCAIQEEIDALIENGTFAWALGENRPVLLSSRDFQNQILLHTLSTNSRIRGMFAGWIEDPQMHITSISLALLSIVLLNAGNAIESFELYSFINQMNKDLEKQNDNYRLLFESSPDGVEVLDDLGYIIDCNSTYQQLIGYERDHIVGRHTSEFFSEQSRGGLDLCAVTYGEQGYSEREIELVCRNGSTIPIWRREKAIYDKERGLIGSVIHNQDLSALKRTEQEKRDLEARLQRAQKMEALGTLAGGVAHDLNNILAGIVSYPELLLLEIPEASPMRRPVQTIMRAGERAAAVVQDLLTMARRGVSATEVLNLNRIVSDHFRSSEHERLVAAHPDVRFDVQLDSALLNIKGSPVHLSKTVMNLLFNAVEAMPHGGAVTVQSSNQYVHRPLKGYEHVAEGDYVVLSVSDTGIGIPARDIERIFEPFYTRKVMGRSGTGLGLAVVWGTVKDHNGYIDVQSAEGEGTTLKLFFPVTAEAPPERGTALPYEAYMGNGETILIVDDIAEQREIASAILARLGYQVHAFSGGEAVVDYLKDHTADLLILDMIMQPGIDGLETYRRALTLHPHQKALLVSGYSETWRVKEAQQLGAGAYIRKPYLFETLAAEVKAELQRQASPGQNTL